MRKDELAALAREAIGSLRGDALVQRHLEVHRPHPGPGGRILVLALGKAAPAMALGAAQALGPLEGLVIGTEVEPVAGMEVLAGDHPVPGPRSFVAGRRLLAQAASLRPADVALVLLSGGGSALAEAPAAGLDEDDLARTTRALLMSGLPIAQVNAVRRRLSRIKAGGLLAALGTERIVALALSDVEGDDGHLIASGPLHPGPLPIPPPGWLPREAWAGRVGSVLDAGAEHQGPGPRLTILAGPDDMARAARDAAVRSGLACEVLPFVSGDVEAVATRWIGMLAKPGAPLLAAAAEPTVLLPPGAPPGGRSQHVALLVARALRDTSASFVAMGSDGRDGATQASGAAVDGTTDDGTLDVALLRFDAASACARLGVQLPRQRTGTNLADLHLLARS